MLDWPQRPPTPHQTRLPALLCQPEYAWVVQDTYYRRRNHRPPQEWRNLGNVYGGIAMSTHRLLKGIWLSGRNCMWVFPGWESVHVHMGGRQGRIVAMQTRSSGWAGPGHTLNSAMNIPVTQGDPSSSVPRGLRLSNMEPALGALTAYRQTRDTANPRTFRPEHCDGIPGDGIAI